MTTSEAVEEPYSGKDILALACDAPNMPVDTCFGRLRALSQRKFVEDAAELHEALVWATSYRLVPDSKPGLRPCSLAAAPVPADLPDEVIGRLRTIVDDVVPIDLRARIWDLLWEARRIPEAGRAATLGYMCAAEELAATMPAARIARRVGRAFGICRMMKSDESSLRQRAIQFVDSDLHPTPARILVSSTLADRGVDDLQPVAETVRELARELAPEEGSEAGFDWEWFRRTWEIVATLYSAAGDKEKRDQAYQTRAQSFARQAEWLKQRGARATMVADLLEKAIRNYLQLGLRREADGLRQELSHAQGRRVEEMASWSSEGVDLTDLAEQARETVAGKSWRAALLALVGAVASPHTDNLRAEAERSRREFPLLFLIPRRIVDKQGRTVATESDEEALLRADMIQNLTNTARFTGIGVVEPARRQILAEHNPGQEEWIALLGESPIPAERIRAWATGLDAGLRGDWLVALHLLLPQVEHLLRTVLESHGHSVTSFRDEGIEVGNAFGGLVRHPGLAAILTEGLVFELEALLVDRSGLNLRNRLAHGELPDGAYHAEYCAYAWHLALRLALIPVLVGDLEIARAPEGGDLIGTEPERE